MSTPSFYCFPKFLGGLGGIGAEAMAQQVAAAGCQGIAIPVREGYWVEPATLASGLRPFQHACAQAGLRADYAVIPDLPATLLADPAPLQILASAGVRRVRIGYLKGPDPAAGFAPAQEELTALAELAGRIGLQIVVQCHHGTWHSSPEAAWHLVRHCDPTALGIKVDPGNQCHEGRADPRRALALLGPHLAAVGVKDAAWERAADGTWRVRWVDSPGGCAGWNAWAEALREYSNGTSGTGFSGPYVFHAFAHAEDPKQLIAGLTAEVAWLRAALLPHAISTST